MLNNAGVAGRNGPTEWLNKQDYQKVCAVNIFGMVDVTVTFLPLIKKEKGRVINTGECNATLNLF